MRETRITLRMPFELGERIAAEATANNRSMNAEIVSRLTGAPAAATVGLRDQIAGQALVGLLSAGRHGVYERDGDGALADRPQDLEAEYPDEGWVAYLAYAMADAMLAERAKGGA